MADLRETGFEEGHLGVQGPGATGRQCLWSRWQVRLAGPEREMGERGGLEPLYLFIRACLRVSPGGQALFQAPSMPGLGEARPIWGGAGTVQGAVLAQEAHP